MLIAPPDPDRATVIGSHGQFSKCAGRDGLPRGQGQIAYKGLAARRLVDAGCGEEEKGVDIVTRLPSLWGVNPNVFAADAAADFDLGVVWRGVVLASAI